MPKVIDEESIIKLLWMKLGRSQDPFNDDVAWVSNKSGKNLLVAKSDMLVAATDVPRKMSALQVARKSLVSCASDFASKGVNPSFCIISLGLPKKCANRKFVTELAHGFARAQDEYGIRIVGGDTNETSSGIVIDCSIFGFSDHIVKRKGARPGDYIGVSGPFGLQPAGLLTLKGKTTSRDLGFNKLAINSVLNPKARLDFGLNNSRHLSSCTDSSDGLAISLYHLAESSRVNFVLDKIPIAHGVEKFASENKLNPDDLALFGGEEFELVFTFDPKHSGTLSQSGAITIGKVSKLEKKGEPRVYYRNKKISRRGWLHFG